MNINLTGKNALVCGSSDGIGKAIAMELAKLGATVTLLARNEDKLNKVIDELDISQNQKHDFLVADMNYPDKLKTTVENYLSNKVIHILINNTGGPAAGEIINAKPEEFLLAMTNHLICNHILVQAVVPKMKEDGYGRIINIISTSVKQPIKGLGVSNTTRGAVASWAKTLANEVGRLGITVNNILPGSTNTQRIVDLISNKSKKSGKPESDVKKEMLAEIPMGRFGEPSEIADVAAFLCTPAAAYINGVSIAVDGGRTSAL